MVTRNIADQFEGAFSPEQGTQAIENAINDETVDTIILKDKGSPWLITEQINLQSNKTIIFEPGVVVRAEGDNFLETNVSLFEARNVDNVNLIGRVEKGQERAVLEMNRAAYDRLDRQPILDENGQQVLDDREDPEKFEAQFNHVVELLGVDGYEVSGIEITGGGGDGIHIAGGTFNTPPEEGSGILPYSQNGLIEDVISDNNRRQGLSIDSANGLTVRDSTFSNTGGATPEPPEAGIDLEPTWDFERLQEIVIEDVTIDNNSGAGILLPLGNLEDDPDNDSDDISINIRDVNIKNVDSDSRAIFVTNRYIYDRPDSAEADFKGEPDRSLPEAMIDGEINFENVTISNAESIENSSEPSDNPRVYIFVQDISGSQQDPDNLQINFNNVDIIDPTDKSVETTPIYINGSAADRLPEIGNLSFNEVEIVGSYSPSVVFIDLEDENANLNDISGDITVFNSGDGAISVVDDNTLPRKNFSLEIIDGNINSTDPITGEVELINPGFQNGLNGWNGRSEDITIVGRSNDNSWVRFSSSLTGGITQDITGKITSGENYQLNATARVEDLETYAAIGINYKNETGELLEVQNIDINSDTTQNFELGLTVPDNFATAEIFAYKEEGSALFVDDFVLAQV